MTCRRWLASICLLGTLALPACSRRAAAPGPGAGTGKAPAEFVIGVVPEHSLFRQLQRYEPLARYLTHATGVRVRLTTAPSYEGVLADLGAGRLDGAFLGSLTYALAHEHMGVVPLARPEGTDGKSSYRGLLLARKDSGIRTAQDFRGKRLALVDRLTTAGYLLPLDYLARAGIRDYATFVGEYYFAGTHEDVIQDVLDRKADVGGAKSSVYERMLKDDPRLGTELAIIEQSPEMPENTLAVRRELDPVFTLRVREALLGMDATPEGREALGAFGARRFVPTEHAEYETVYRYAREVGLNLSNLQSMAPAAAAR